MKRTILTARRQRCGYGYDAEGGAGMVANLAWRPGPDEPLATDNASSVDRGLRDDAGHQGDHGGIWRGIFCARSRSAWKAPGISRRSPTQRQSMR